MGLGEERVGREERGMKEARVGCYFTLCGRALCAAGDGQLALALTPTFSPNLSPNPNPNPKPCTAGDGQLTLALTPPLTPPLTPQP